MWLNPHVGITGKTFYTIFPPFSVCGKNETNQSPILSRWVQKATNTTQIHFADKNSSPSHQRTISLSDIRLARLTTVSDQQLTEATLQGAAAALNSTNTSGADNIITIKQESITSVDNLVGSYVDSTTFLPSPNSQIINANLVQSIAMANDANDGNN
jgi:hypothetical protein